MKAKKKTKKQATVLYNKATKTFSWGYSKDPVSGKHRAFPTKQIWLKEDAKSLLKVFNSAYKLILKSWTQKYYATNAKGKSVDYDSRAAVSFCLAGALLKSKGTFLAEMYIKDYFTSPVEFNDAKNRTKEEVLDLLDHVRNSLILL